MAAINSSVLACNYAISGIELNAKLASTPSVACPVGPGHKLPVIRAQQARVSEAKESRGSEGRRAALLYLTATLFTTAAAASNSSANAGVIEEYHIKSGNHQKNLSRQPRPTSKDYWFGVKIVC